MKPIVLVAEVLEPGPMAWLVDRTFVRKGPPDEHDLADVEGLVVRSYTTVDAALLDRMPKLKVVGRGGVGLESIDVAECRRRGVEVVYTPNANTKAVGEFVIGTMLRLIRTWHANDVAFEPAAFKQQRRGGGLHLSDLTVGIVGMGRVGRRVATLLERGFGTKVLYHDIADVDVGDLSAQAVNVDRLRAESDIISVHVDGRPENRGMIDADWLGAGRFRWLINTSRGLVVDAEEVLKALQSGWIEGVALDVFDPEPPLRGSAYETMQRDFANRVQLTPHMASRTWDAVEAMSWVVRDVVAVLQGQQPKHVAP